MVSLPAKPASPEQGPETSSRVPEKVLVVSQPEQLRDILSEIEQITEEASSRAQENATGGGVSPRKGQKQPIVTASARALAIATLPPPKTMQRELRQHIEREVKNLRREARRIVRVSKPGTAYRLNMLYARIRRLNALLSNLIEASVEVLKRFFIRVFIDRQPIL